MTAVTGLLSVAGALALAALFLFLARLLWGLPLTVSRAFAIGVAGFLCMASIGLLAFANALLP